jgi:undecaprenyl-diphosphatase
MKAYYIKLIITIAYFIIILIAERLYNEKLFNLSLEIIPKFQDASKSMNFFWVFISYFGTKPLIGTIYVIFFLFIPLNKVYSLMFLMLLTGFIDHTLKIIYLQERPIWLNTEIETGNNHSCGYGNPSGHSLSSTCLYLSFWYIFSQSFDTSIKMEKYKKVLKYLILVSCIFLFLFIMISRLYLGVHSLNQIIFGSSIGLGLFLLFLPTLQIYQSSGSEFLINKYAKRYLHLSLIILSIIIFYISFFLQTNIKGLEEKPNWIKMCNKQKETRTLIYSSFTGGMAIYIILGMNLGLYYCKAKIDEEFNSQDDIIINWHKEAFSNRIIRLLFMLMGFFPIGIFLILYYSLDVSIILFYFLAPILFVLGGFMTFAPCIFYGYKCTRSKFKNNEIYPFEPDLNNAEADYSNEELNH